MWYFCVVSLAACRRPGAAGLEDGTLPFTAIAAARHGFQQLQRLGGFPAISRHTACLSWHLMLRLLQLRHSNGGPAAVLYCHPAVQQLLQEHLTPAQSAAANSSTSDSTSRVVDTGTTSTSSSRSRSTAGEGVSGGCGAKFGQVVVPAASVMERFRELQGPVVCFNLLRPDGSWVGHKEVGKLAAIHSICLRTGVLMLVWLTQPSRRLGCCWY
jgi:molybdenum cofactor sulfurtransferase